MSPCLATAAARPAVSNLSSTGCRATPPLRAPLAAPACVNSPTVRSRAARCAPTPPAAAAKPAAAMAPPASGTKDKQVRKGKQLGAFHAARHAMGQESKSVEKGCWRLSHKRARFLRACFSSHTLTPPLPPAPASLALPHL